MLKALTIRAYVDGNSHLIVQGEAVHWHHLDFAAPGRELGVNLPTYLDDIAWYPTWPDVPDPENRFCNCDSSSFVGVPRLAAQTQSVILTIHAARADARIIQQPAESNRYTLIVEFNDNEWHHSEWYVITLTYLSSASNYTYLPLTIK